MRQEKENNVDLTIAISNEKQRAQNLCTKLKVKDQLIVNLKDKLFSLENEISYLLKACFPSPTFLVRCSLHLILKLRYFARFTNRILRHTLSIVSRASSTLFHYIRRHPRLLTFKIATILHRKIFSVSKRILFSNDRYREFYDSCYTEALTKASQDYVSISNDQVDLARTTVRTIAFYLPQFHPIPENDNTWGTGFTEWTNVSKAVPQFLGHYQPRLPGELGFYDLRLSAIQKRQIELARQYGIDGFCYYYYWFNGKRVLELPFQRVLQDSSLDLPFCLCWANENWSKRWDGSDDEIILSQSHSPEDDLHFFADILPALKDPRYIRIDGKPLLIVYRPGLLPDARATASRWRKAASESGLPGLYISSAATFDFKDYKQIGYDGLVQFPPHNLSVANITHKQKLLNPGFKGNVYDYQAYALSAIADLDNDGHSFPCVMMGWDNEARKPGRGNIFLGCNPEIYKNLLRSCFKFVLSHNYKSEQIVFINAWNEWAEGTYLEPDRRYGYAYLQATADVHREFYAQ